MENREKMSIAERAKQFMPFSALKGYEEMVKDSEEVFSEKKEISEDKAKELTLEMQKIKRGDEIYIEYYKDGKYIKKHGIVANVDFAFATITVIKEKVLFNDIYDVKKVEEQ